MTFLTLHIYKYVDFRGFSSNFQTLPKMTKPLPKIEEKTISMVHVTCSVILGAILSVKFNGINSRINSNLQHPLGI